MNSFFIADTAKSFEEASADLEVAVAAEGFGVLAVQDLGNSLRGCSAPSLRSGTDEVARQVDASATAIIQSAASLSTQSASMPVR